MAKSAAAFFCLLSSGVFQDVIFNFFKLGHFKPGWSQLLANENRFGGAKKGHVTQSCTTAPAPPRENAILKQPPPQIGNDYFKKAFNLKNHNYC